MPNGPPPASLPPLSPEERTRYRRHLLLPELGEAGQRRLKGARVLLVGAGGLGSPIALYLAAAGVGTLGVVEFDAVDAGNLQRQVLYGTGDVGRAKAEAACDRLRALNPNVRVEPHGVRLDAANARSLVAGHDLAVDATDNLEARYALNDACVALGRPFVHGSIFRFEGQVAVLAAPGGPCLRCLHPEPPPAGALPASGDVGVLGVVPGLVGLLQAAEAVKWIAGLGEPLVGRLLLVDVLRMEFRTVKLPRDPACAACGDAAVAGGGSGA